MKVSSWYFLHKNCAIFLDWFASISTHCIQSSMPKSSKDGDKVFMWLTVEIICATQWNAEAHVSSNVLARASYS